MARAEVLDCIVVGAGPGGLVSAVYLQRFRRKVLLIDGGPPRALRIPRIRNLVGYEKGISGRELLKRLHRQYAACGGNMIKGRACVAKETRRFSVKVNGRKYFAKSVILATGMRDVDPPFGNLRELTRDGVLGYCPVCDAFDHRDQKIALIVRDETGLNKISFMSTFSRDLVAVMMRPFAVNGRLRKVIGRLNVELVTEAPVRMRRARRGVEFRFKKRAPLKTDAAYVFLGVQVPGDAVLGLPKIKRDKEGFLRVSDHFETSVRGLYAVGDCTQGLAQVSTAVGAAAIAATRIHNKLREDEGTA